MMLKWPEDGKPFIWYLFFKKDAGRPACNIIKKETLAQVFYLRAAAPVKYQVPSFSTSPNAFKISKYQRRI